MKCSEGLVNVNSMREPVCLKCSERLVKVSTWALGVVALMVFMPSGDVA